MKKTKKEKSPKVTKAKLRVQKKQTNAELIALKRQLSIEASLDRVRKKALSMKKPDDLLKICKAIYTELQLLGFDDLRNSMINIHNDDDESLLNYDYAKAGPTITHFTYHTHPVIENLVRQMKRGRAAFSEQVLSGKKLAAFKAFRKSHGEKTDAKLKNAKALYYYFYSIGTGALGISNLAPLSADQLKILKGFRNVFDLAYQRYAHIQNAEAQAREVQIQLALEKVRARTMAMRKSDELSEVVSALYQQIETLGFAKGGCELILCNEKSGSLEYWHTNPVQSSVPARYCVSPEVHTFFKKVWKAWKQHAPMLVIEMKDKEKRKLDLALFEKTDFKRIDKKTKNWILKEKIAVFSHVTMKFGLLEAIDSAAISAEQLLILQRFAKVFEQTYTRFLDLQKAEAQAREAQIEVALERVRSRSMGMQKSEELKEVIKIVYQQLTHLKINLDHTGFVVDYIPRGDWHFWIADEQDIPSKIAHPYFESVWANQFNEAKEKGADIFGTNLNFEEKNKFYNELLSYVPGLPEASKDFYLSCPGLAVSTVLLDNVGLYIENFSGISYSDEENAILMRFGKVFQQTYTRFLDLQKAEAQARESQVEAALERVRSRSMAMHKSEELCDVIAVVSQQLQQLKFRFDNASFVINSASEDYDFWFSIPGMHQPHHIHVPYLDNPINNEAKEARNRGLKFHADIISPADSRAWHQHMFDHNKMDFLSEEARKLVLKGGFARSVAIMTNIMLVVGNYASKAYSEEENDIIRRFATVFEQAYTRFLDLQKAEAQAREAQIQLALERVRARAMAMQRSDELKELIGTLSTELGKLDIILDRCFIIIYDLQSMGSTWWMSNPETPSEPVGLFVKYHDYPHYLAHIEAWKQRKLKWQYVLEGKNKIETDAFLFTETELSQLPDSVIANMKSKERVYLSSSFNNFGYLTLATLEPLSDEQFDIMLRFAQVFDLTYTRFNDLKQAEAQAREARIEAALERVRSKTMAMHKSEQLSETAHVLFEQFAVLGKIPDRISIGIINEELKFFEWWVTDQFGSQVTRQFKASILQPTHAKWFTAWKEGKDALVVDLSGEDLKEWIAFVRNEVNMPIDESKMKGRRVHHAAFFSQGLLLISAHEPMPNETMLLLLRFAKVFNQTYTRFLDLQKAEAQAREAQIEAGLERVRSKTMAMHNSHDVGNTVASLFDELVALGLEKSARCGIGILDESDRMELWTASTNDKGELVLAIGHLDMTLHPLLKGVKKTWSSKKQSFTYELQGEDLLNYFNTLNDYPDYRIYIDIKTLPEKIIHNSFYFTDGLIFSFTPHPISEDFAKVFKRFAGVFGQTYKRYLDLRKAEEQAREAEIELALERVRARTMAMQKSEELPETSFLVFQQMKALGETAVQNSIAIIKEDEGFVELSTTVRGLPESRTLKVPIDDPHVMSKAVAAWKAKRKSLLVEFHGQELKDYNELRNSFLETKVNFPEDNWIVNIIFFSNGWLSFSSNHNISKESFQLLERFAGVFDLTYTRFSDLQKAEKQARQAQIEAALEKVRSRTLAMHTAHELGDVVLVIVEKLKELGVVLDANGVILCTYFQNSKNVLHWIASPDFSFAGSYLLPYFDHPIFKDAWESKMSGTDYFSKSFSVEEKNSFFEYAFEHSDYKYFPDEFKQWVFQNDKHSLSFAWQKNSAILIPSHTGTVPGEGDKEILKRFSKVFEQAYIRFLDLQTAEAQAREAQIEAALERVRSRSMAMHKSDELADLSLELVKQVQALGVATWFCAFNIYDEDGSGSLEWGSNGEGTFPRYRTPREGIFLRYYEAGKRGETLLINEIGENECPAHYQYLCRLPGVGEQLLKMKDAGIPFPVSQIDHVAFFKYGYLLFITYVPTPESHDIFKRFAKVFEQTYTRFLDLQKAEAQAREAQIEAALERIRSRALAMHTSGDLIDVANVLRDQMGLLGQPELESSIVHLYPDNSNTFETWYAYRPPDLSSGKIITGAATVYTDSSEWSREVIERYGSPDNEYTIVSSGQKINEWYKVVEAIAPAVVEYDHDGQLIVPEILYYHFSKFSGGALLMISNQQPSVEARELQKRAAVVFGLAVTRFLDLKKAEEQAREAKIEASLERVRGKAMAMHSSEDLAATIGIFYRELESFSITPRRCGVGLLDKETRDAELSTMNTTDKGDSIEIVGKIKMQGHPVLEGVYDNWILQQEYHPVLRGNEIREYYQLLRPQIAFPEYPNDAVQYGYFFFFTEGGVYAWTEKELNEDELKIYRKFTSVLSLTYKRYKDLKDAEIRAQEAVKQATIDRVRAEIASMRTKQDLDRITPLIWNELTILGIPFVRCGVFIMDDELHQVHTFLSTPDGKAIGAFQLDYETDNLKEAIRHWHGNQVYVTHWGAKEFGEMAGTLQKQGSIVSRDQYLSTLPTEDIYLHFLPFLQGMLYVGNVTPLQQEDLHLVQALAEAFSTAYARYEDFNKLEAAKQQVDQALVELRQTQQQLVQSEKMASLGELTAGIAHEIQNPLNFVNNFSEVSNELIDEMVEEVKKGNFDEAKVIINDLKQNLEKINHHGKRADGIVKSMLQHSRTSSGQKELTDLNVLCDEYLRLSYHGLRAKDKSFNAKFETDFDATLEKINVLPQDIGRVILNLINNAFYAVTEKRNANLDGYEPTVSVSTKQRDGKVEITVKDNGSGISQRVLDKIFQPFFTTKPTGQGTGLGLSLSYDIIKVHGGELKVKTEEGVGSVFIIQIPIN